MIPANAPLQDVAKVDYLGRHHDGTGSIMTGSIERKGRFASSWKSGWLNKSNSAGMPS